MQPYQFRWGFFFEGVGESRTTPCPWTLDMDFKKLNGLIPAVAQDVDSGEVLMVGFMNDRALEETRKQRLATFFSRSRGSLWTKGETSGNLLAVKQILVDCDDDTVLLKVKRLGSGNVCHTGARSCFFRDITEGE